MSARQLLLKGQCLPFVFGVGQVESCRRHRRVSSCLCTTVQPAGQCSSCPRWSEKHQEAGIQQYAAKGMLL